MTKDSNGILLPLGGAIGIDPGSASGCVAYVTADFAAAWPIGKLTDQEVWSRIQALGAIAHIAALERVSSMPKQGVASAFKFGASYGGLRMALAALSVPWRLVGPTEWQTAMRCRTGGDKRVSRAAAQRLWPQLKITHLTADALLLAEFARRSIPGQIPRGEQIVDPGARQPALKGKQLKAALAEFL